VVGPPPPHPPPHPPPSPAPHRHTPDTPPAPPPHQMPHPPPPPLPPPPARAALARHHGRAILHSAAPRAGHDDDPRNGPQSRSSIFVRAAATSAFMLPAPPRSKSAPPRRARCHAGLGDLCPDKNVGRATATSEAMAMPQTPAQPTHEFFVWTGGGATTPTPYTPNHRENDPFHLSSFAATHFWSANGGPEGGGGGPCLWWRICGVGYGPRRLVVWGLGGGVGVGFGERLRAQFASGLDNRRGRVRPAGPSSRGRTRPFSSASFTLTL